jgi:hypothetical protein
MIDDLVTRLRIGAPTIEKCYEAADRIEQLKAALQLIADACAENEWPDGTQQIARAALGGKKDD